MANKNLFNGLRNWLLPATDTRNEAGGTAYKLDGPHALAQFAVTGCLNSTFYATDAQQLQKVLQLCQDVAPEFIARTALFARERGFMKDLPALLVAVLSVRSPGLMAEVFDRVIDSPKMLRNFVQIMRSGVVGRKSLGSLPKRLVRQWLDARSDEAIFRASVGNAPALADILRMVHPKPKSKAREALYGYLVGQPHEATALPALVQQFEAFKQAKDRHGLDVPDVPFQMLTALDLSRAQWQGIARQAPWQMTRMNLNTFARHGVLEDRALCELIAARLRNPELIAQAKVFPYQLLVAYLATVNALPTAITEALQDAMETAIDNVPAVPGQVYVFPDVSGSMHSPVTGQRQGATTAARCIDVAALVAAAVLRKNRSAQIVPFAESVLPVQLNPRDSVMSNAQKLAALPAGGTNCSAPLMHLNARKAEGDLVIYVSDNESWIDSPNYGRYGGAATQTMNAWAEFRRRSPKAKMVCIDIQPHGSTQGQERDDILNVGGFSDQVFDLLGAVAKGHGQRGYWVSQIEAVRI